MALCPAMSHQVYESVHIARCTCVSLVILPVTKRSGLPFISAHNCLVLWAVIPHITLAYSRDIVKLIPLFPPQSVTTMIHTIRFVLYCILVSLPLAHSLPCTQPGSAVSLRSCHNGIVRGENTLHHSHTLLRPNELWSSVLR